MRFDYYTLRRNRDSTVDVLGWDTYPESSVLAGQTRKTYLNTFDTVKDARDAYPEAQQFSNAWTEPQVSLMHLNPDGDLGGDCGYGEPNDY